MKVALLTGGGDCPGLNAVIRAVVRTIHNAGGECIGLLEGWRGAITGNHIPLKAIDTDEIIARGGTMLGSSRTNPYKEPANVQKLVDTFANLELSALVAIGGDAQGEAALRAGRDSCGAAHCSRRLNLTFSLTKGSTQSFR